MSEDLKRQAAVASLEKIRDGMIDEGKLVPRLGSRSVIPVEVIPFAADLVTRQFASWGGHAAIRQKNGKPFISDNGNFVIDWKHGEIPEPANLEKQIKGITGVV